ncbi:hypothetical protein [Corynebacterium callunae]|uniref:hypothetical protein n=1 Tax=Corynebacterium callunae TaxID=1721 RepID=UPI002000514F|nr:hypothetical protein [Corynebacterium callunae]MCK2199551.1 hypothetical protein [Corynebacterium callunae]
MIFSKSSLVKTATALSLAGTVMLASIFPAHAGTTDPELSLSELGGAEAIGFPGRTVEVSLGVRVPAGTTPETLTGNLQLPSEYSGGILELYKDGRILKTIPLTVKDNLAPVSLPLKDIPVEDGRIDFSLRAVMDVAGDQWCFKETESTLLDGKVKFSGTTANPTVIADFFPSVMRSLTIYTPENPSDSTKEATLEIASSLGSTYRTSNIDIDVKALPEGTVEPPTAPGDFERQIVLVESEEDAKTELINAGADNAFLMLSGVGEQLYDQARLLTDAMLPLAVETEVTAAGFGDIPNLATDVATLSELGIVNLHSESVARTSVAIGIERSRLRTYSAGLQVHLTGTYTPQPAQNSGQITISVGDTVLDSFTPDETGTINREFEVSGELLGRYSEIIVEYKSTGEISCGQTQPIGLNIDSESLVSSHHTDTPILSGFSTLPQAFQPSVDVALSEGTVADLGRAVDVVMGIQSLSSQRIRPHVVGWDEAVVSQNPTVFIDANGEKSDQLPSYLKQSDSTLEVTSKNEQNAENAELTRVLQTNGSLVAGALQAVWDAENSRIIVVASSQNNARQLDGLLAWLDADNARWTQLTGDVIVQVRDREPVQLSTVEKPDQPINASKVGLAVGIGVLIVAIITVVSIWLSRRAKAIQTPEQSQ